MNADLRPLTRGDEAFARRGSDAPRQSRARSILTVFAVMVALQLALAVFSIDLLSAVRAFVTGESLYSKGQKDAQLYLVEYSAHHRDSDYQHFLHSLEVPIGDRTARVALLKAIPDEASAWQGLLAGGTPVADIPGVIRLFRWFHGTPLMANPIETWTEGDALIEKMRLLAAAAHEQVAAGNLSSLDVLSLRSEAQRINDGLTPLEILFAGQLADAARSCQRLLLAVNLALASLLGVSGLFFVRHSSRVQSNTEDEVRRRQDSLQRLLDSAAEGVYGVDTRGRCTFINHSALSLLGYSHEDELLGRDLTALIHVQRSGMDRPSAWSYADGHEVHRLDEKLCRRDGTCFPAELWVHPMMLDGHSVGAVGTFFDISERVNMQLALRQGEVRIAGLVDAVNDGVMTFDTERRIVLFNRAAERMFGISATEALGTSVERFMPGGPWNTWTDCNEESARGSLREFAGRRADGQSFPLEGSLSHLQSESGLLITAVLRDATEIHAARAQRREREALEASSRAKTEFLSRMSHELRTPLNAVVGFAQLLRMSFGSAEATEQLSRIQHIENAGSHLLALVNDILDLSGVEAGHIAVKMEPVGLQSAVDGALSMVLPVAERAGIRTIVGGGSSGAESTQRWNLTETVWADPVRLRQVLVNLLTNAIKYNRSGGTVHVNCRALGDQCELSVRDEGMGMSPVKLQRLFEPFNRLGAEQTKVEGTGIGLVVSRRLVELMGGELHIESVVGVGTVARLILPCSPEAPISRPSSTSSQHGTLDGGFSVLYAEDNEVNVEIVRAIMALRPSVVFDVAESGAIALRKARQMSPQLMLVDMNLGDMTGIELAESLLADPVTSGIQLVALSADALPEQISAALARGFARYITKPIDVRELLDVLDSAEWMSLDEGESQELCRV